MMRRLLVPVLALVLAPAGLAASFSFSVVTASPVTVPTVTLSGDDQTKTFTVTTQVAYTGSGNTAGWKVQASSTTLTYATTHTLPAMQVTAGSYTCQSGCTSNPSPTGVTYPIALSATAATIYNAAANSGRGTFRVSNTFQVTYPASAVAGTYSATLTLTGATGPT